MPKDDKETYKQNGYKNQIIQQAIQQHYTVNTKANKQEEKGLTAFLPLSYTEQQNRYRYIIKKHEG